MSILPRACMQLVFAVSPIAGLATADGSPLFARHAGHGAPQRYRLTGSSPSGAGAKQPLLPRCFQANPPSPPPPVAILHRLSPAVDLTPVPAARAVVPLHIDARSVKVSAKPYLTRVQATTANSRPQQQQHSSFAESPANGSSPQAKPRGKGKGKRGRGGGGGGGDGSAAGASSVSSGVKLEDVSITFKNQQVLRGVSWDVKTGERVGLVGARSIATPQVATHPLRICWNREHTLWEFARGHRHAPYWDVGPWGLANVMLRRYDQLFYSTAIADSVMSAGIMTCGCPCHVHARS